MRENDKVPSFHQGTGKSSKESHGAQELKEGRKAHPKEGGTVQAKSLKWRIWKRSGELGHHEEIVQMRKSKKTMPRL